MKNTIQIQLGRNGFFRIEGDLRSAYLTLAQVPAAFHVLDNTAPPRHIVS
jgi:hypothetical protein